MKIHHGAIVYNVVTSAYAKFGDDRLWNEKALAGRKSDNNNPNKNNVRSAWRPGLTRSDTHQKGIRQFDEQRRGVLSTFSHLWQAVRRDIWRRTEVIKTIPKKATAVAETSTITNKGCYYMKFFTKKLSYCWETLQRESMPRIAVMDVEMTTYAERPSNVLQGHQKWHQSKASVWFPISCP